MCFFAIAIVFVLSLVLLPSSVFRVVLNGGGSSFSFFRPSAKQVFEIIGQSSTGWLETLSRQLVHESLCMDMHRSTLVYIYIYMYVYIGIGIGELRNYHTWRWIAVGTDT